MSQSDFEQQMDKEIMQEIEQEPEEQEIALETEMEEPLYGEEFEFELEEEPFEGEIEEKEREFTEKILQISKGISQNEYESESQVEDAVNELMNDMEREYFFKGLWKKAKKGFKRVVKKGLKFVKKKLPAFKVLKAVSQLARGNLKGALGALAKAGLGTAIGTMIPGGAALLPALKTLGFEATEEPERNREAWSNFVGASREAFDYLARNLDDNVDDPEVANRLAAEAFKYGLKKNERPYTRISTSAPKKGYVVRVRKGESVTLRIVGE